MTTFKAKKKKGKLGRFMTDLMLTLTRILSGAGLLTAALAINGCASYQEAARAETCAEGEERMRVGPRGKGGAPQYVCR